MNDVPKKAPHLKPYHFKKGTRPPNAGIKKGTRRWSTELTLELLCDAALIDPETGKRMSAKSLKRRLSKHIWSDARILLNYLDRKLGKVADKVDSQITFVLDGSVPTKSLDDSTIVDGQFMIPELPSGNDDDNDSNNE